MLISTQNQTMNLSCMVSSARRALHYWRLLLLDACCLFSSLCRLLVFLCRVEIRCDASSETLSRYEGIEWRREDRGCTRDAIRNPLIQTRAVLRAGQCSEAQRSKSSLFAIRS